MFPRPCNLGAVIPLDERPEQPHHGLGHAGVPPRNFQTATPVPLMAVLVGGLLHPGWSYRADHQDQPHLGRHHRKRGQNADVTLSLVVPDARMDAYGIR